MFIALCEQRLHQACWYSSKLTGSSVFFTKDKKEVRKRRSQFCDIRQLWQILREMEMLNIESWTALTSLYSLFPNSINVWSVLFLFRLHSMFCVFCNTHLVRNSYVIRRQNLSFCRYYSFIWLIVIRFVCP